MATTHTPTRLRQLTNRRPEARESTDNRASVGGLIGVLVEAQRYLAANPATPLTDLVALTASQDTYVREAVARNPASTLQLLCLLWDDSDEENRVLVRDRVSAEQFAQWKQEALPELADLPDEMFLDIYRTLPQASEPVATL